MEKLSAEVTALKRKLKDAEEAGDDERTRSQAQRIQLLDEVCTPPSDRMLHADKKAQLAASRSRRAAQAATTDQGGLSMLGQKISLFLNPIDLEPIPNRPFPCTPSRDAIHPSLMTRVSRIVMYAE